MNYGLIGFFFLVVVTLVLITCFLARQPIGHQSHHGTQHLVVSCIDFRFRKQIHHWIEKNLGQADHLAIAGASKYFTDPSARPFLIDQLRLAVSLHGVKTISLIDHLDCGAYKHSRPQLTPEEERQAHLEHLHTAAQLIRQQIPEISVMLYLIHPQDEKVELVP